jgi:aspartate/methionine/tyrosine aminotransferase
VESQVWNQAAMLFVFRSFSKAWGLAGLRVGYAIGGPGSEELLGEPRHVRIGLRDSASTTRLLGAVDKAV